MSRKIITKEELIILINKEMSGPEMSNFLGCSVDIIRNRLKKYNLKPSPYKTCKCQRKIKHCNVKKHKNSCNGFFFTGPNNPSKNKTGFTVKEEWKQSNGKYKCPICYKSFSKKGLTGHYWRMHDKIGIQCKPHNYIKQHKNQFTSGVQKHLSLSTREKLRNINTGKKMHTEEFKKRQSNNAKKRGLGGPTVSGHYKGVDSYNNHIYFDSKWEIKVANSLNEYNIKWLRKINGFRWIDECGISHLYYPDFYLPKYNVYLDPKNPWVLYNDSYKLMNVLLHHNIHLLILERNELTWDIIKNMI